MAEHLIVDQEVVGSSPTGRPKDNRSSLCLNKAEVYRHYKLRQYANINVKTSQ